MDYLEFKNLIQNYPVFRSSDICHIADNIQLLRDQINDWQKKGLLLALKRGMYILNENDRKITPSRMFLSNQLFSPSYVSLEYALSFYGIIPEHVYDVTAVTSKKTAIFKNRFGLFRYQHIKTSCLKGFIEISDENKMPVFIATPEKAVVDFLYFKSLKFSEIERDVFDTSFRFQNIERLKKGMLKEYASLFGTKKVLRFIALLLQYMGKK